MSSRACWGRVYEAYYRAAIEWNGVGQGIEATKYARLCLDRGLAFRGPDRPFVDAMRELVNDPEKHWSWKFRLNGRNGRKQQAGLRVST